MACVSPMVRDMRLTSGLLFRSPSQEGVPPDMSQIDKLIQKAQESPRNLRTDEVMKLYEYFGWEQRVGKSKRGSHRVLVKIENGTPKEKTFPERKQVNKMYVVEMLRNFGLG